MTISAFLLDDHELVRECIRHLLEMEDDISVVGEAATVADALQRIALQRPDVAILDVRLPDGDGIEVCRMIRSRYPQTACLILTFFDEDNARERAVLAGASGYVLKQIRGQDLIRSLRVVAGGGNLIDSATRQGVVNSLIDRHVLTMSGGHSQPRLSTRDRQLLALIAEGRTNREIGEALFLAEKTVKNYVSNLLSKLGMSRRAEIAALAGRMKERHDGGSEW